MQVDRFSLVEISKLTAENLELLMDQDASDEMKERLQHGSAGSPLSMRAFAECSVTSLGLALLAFLVSYLNTDAFALTWDTLNHHIYLGAFAETPRWHLDVLAASSQSYQYPYVYWPLYRLSLIQAPGALLGALWVSFLVLSAAPAIWLITYRLLPDGRSVTQSMVLRILAIYLALCTLGVLFSLQTTSNDFLTSIPILWGIALAVLNQSPGNNRYLGAFAIGVGVAFKLSNVVFLCMLPFASLPLRTHQQFITRLVAVSCAASVGFLIAYAPWAWQLYRETANPFHPHLQVFFSAR